VTKNILEFICFVQKIIFEVFLISNFRRNSNIVYFLGVFPRRQIIVGRRFGTLCQFHLQRLHTPHPAFEDETVTGFRNVGQLQFDAGEIPKRTYTIFKAIFKPTFFFNFYKHCS